MSSVKFLIVALFLLMVVGFSSVVRLHWIIHTLLVWINMVILLYWRDRDRIQGDWGRWNLFNWIVERRKMQRCKDAEIWKVVLYVRGNSKAYLYQVKLRESVREWSGRTCATIPAQHLGDPNCNWLAWKDLIKNKGVH
jgi:hypothetical protein